MPSALRPSARRSCAIVRVHASVFQRNGDAMPPNGGKAMSVVRDFGTRCGQCRPVGPLHLGGIPDRN